MDAPQIKETVSVRWVAQRLRRSESSIKRLLEEGKIQGFQHCEKGQWYILKSSVLDYERKLLAAFDGPQDGRDPEWERPAKPRPTI